MNEKHRHFKGGKMSPEYRAWASAISKCGNPQQAAWFWYGARGISVCEEWRRSFPAFLADVGPKPDGNYRLERIDKHDDFTPQNAMWVERRKRK